MVRKPLLLRIYDAASLKRWNDQILPIEFTELDKQAHKMIIAYILGKYEEEKNTKDFDWLEIIEGGIFEFLQRIVLTDLKPSLFERIEKDKQRYSKLNEWVYDRIYRDISSLGRDFCKRFKDYLLEPKRNINWRILKAAHFYSTKWEFNIIERAHLNVYTLEEIKTSMSLKEGSYSDLASVKELLNTKNISNFIDICGHLRFQLRWSHIYRIPKTSVLGHMLIVAILSYLFSLQSKGESKLCINNYFTGLFHDLPEVLTRDIINPVKRSIEGLKELIKEYEQEEMESKIYKLIPASWQNHIHMFTEREFNDEYDKDNQLIRDGDLVKAVDDLAAFIEAYLTCKNGIRNEILESAKYSLIEKYKNKIISGIQFNQIYADFD